MQCGHTPSLANILTLLSLKAKGKQNLNSQYYINQFKLATVADIVVEIWGTIPSSFSNRGKNYKMQTFEYVAVANLLLTLLRIQI